MLRPAPYNGHLVKPFPYDRPNSTHLWELPAMSSELKLEAETDVITAAGQRRRLRRRQ